MAQDIYDGDRKDKIAVYYEEKKQTGYAYDVDDITWKDLDMDQIFAKINRSSSYIGEQVLFHNMHRSKNRKELKDLESHIIFMQENVDDRDQIEKKLRLIGKKRESYFVPMLFMSADPICIGNPVTIRILQTLLSVFVILLLVCREPIFLLSAIIVVVVNFGLYFTSKLQYEPILQALYSFKDFLNFGNYMLRYQDKIAMSEEVLKSADELKTIAKKIYGYNYRKSAALFGDLSSLLWDYIMGITLMDLAMYHKVIREITDHRQQIMAIYEFVGGIDMAVSIASYRKELPYFCEPVIGAYDFISGKDIAHPLLSNGVANDFTLSRRVLITGANASGKSTFMKAIAVNVILAQTIHTVYAREFKMPEIHVYSSIALRDDILTGESYYMREAKRIRYMLDVSSSGRKSLFILDELMKGTNTAERIAASIGILEYFSLQKDFVLAATHDMELISELSGKYENYYFESYVRENDIWFDYMIKKGTGGRSNALALLAILNYPEEILAIAHRKVTLYENRRSI